MKTGIDKSFVEFVVEQIRNVENISYRYMFGGCAIYCGKKVVALICNNQLFVRPTQNGKSFIEAVNEMSPYPEAKPHFLIEDQIDNGEWLSNLIRITAAELPEPKVKKKKTQSKAR
jgi:TfoX/Sxy family transcriptional regulator of competence genes